MHFLILFAAMLALLLPLGAAELSSQEIQSARKLYQTKCAKCHKFYDPAKYDAPDWQRWMQKMGRKAKLKPEQSDLLSRYLDSFRAPEKK